MRRLLTVTFFAVVAMVSVFFVLPGTNVSAASSGCETSVLPSSLCSGDKGDGILGIINIVLDIMTYGVGILATIGMVIAGIIYIVSSGNEEKVKKAKEWIRNIVIGLLAYGILWAALKFLLPGGVENV
jgi:hypothetical protein